MDDDPYDFAAQFRKILENHHKELRESKEPQVYTGIPGNIFESFSRTPPVSRPQRQKLNKAAVNSTITSTAISPESNVKRSRLRSRLNKATVSSTVTSIAISSESDEDSPHLRPKLNNATVNSTVTSTAISSESVVDRPRLRPRLNKNVVNSIATSTKISSESVENRSSLRPRLKNTSKIINSPKIPRPLECSFANTDQKKRKREYDLSSCKVLGPVINIGDFYDGYDTSFTSTPTVQINDEDLMFIPEGECSLAELNRTMNVKVFWRKMRTYTFPIRMFQSIESIYEHFVKLEDINVTQISLKLHGKTLKPKDTPRSINYKISDFIDGELEFYQSICDTLKDKKAEEELSEEEIKLFIMRKNVRKKMIFSIKKTESMLVLYIKISEELKLDTTSFTLHLDGDKIKWSDTVKSLDLEGDECLELHEK